MSLEVIVVFLRFLLECLEIENSAIKIRINGYLNNGISQEQIEDYWLSISGLTRENLGKGTFDTHSAYSSKEKEKSYLWNGVRNSLQHGEATSDLWRNSFRLWKRKQVFILVHALVVQ